MLKCKETIELASNQLDKSLPLLKYLELKIHLLICKTCNQYMQHLKFIHTFSKNIDQNFLEITLPTEAKTRIQENLKNSADNFKNIAKDK